MFFCVFYIKRKEKEIENNTYTSNFFVVPSSCLKQQVDIMAKIGINNMFQMDRNHVVKNGAS